MQTEEKETLNYSKWANGQEFYPDWVLDDAKAIGDTLGIIIDDIYYSGFYSQGDGASFTGTYKYKCNSIKAIVAQFPNDTELHAIARALQTASAKHFYDVTVSIGQTGRYYHSNSMRFSYEFNRFYATNRTVDEDAFSSPLKDFADWIYSQLEAEYDYSLSSEAFLLFCEDYDYIPIDS